MFLGIKFEFSEEISCIWDIAILNFIKRVKLGRLLDRLKLYIIIRGFYLSVT